MANGNGSSAPRSPESVLNRLRAQGLRISTPRRVVVKTLFGAEAPLTAHEIADSDGAELDLATVYRNLETLEELEIVVRVQDRDGSGRWRLAGGGGGYVSCHSCGAVKEVAAPALEALGAALRERCGYELSFSRYPLIGICADCRAGTAS